MQCIFLILQLLSRVFPKLLQSKKVRDDRYIDTQDNDEEGDKLMIEEEEDDDEEEKLMIEEEEEEVIIIDNAVTPTEYYYYTQHQQKDEENDISMETKAKAKAYMIFMERYYADLFTNLYLRYARSKDLTRDICLLTECEQSQMIQNQRSKETTYLRRRREKLSREDFEEIKMIGRGAYGSVCMVRHIQSDCIYALKSMFKHHLICLNQIEHVRSERDFMAANSSSNSHNPWVVDLEYVFVDEETICLVMEMAQGGDMMTWLMRLHQFSESQTRFYIAELVLAIHSVHCLHYVHRDIKPDNILLDQSGHLKLSDFGLCQFVPPTTHSSLPPSPHPQQPRSSHPLHQSYPSYSNHQPYHHIMSCHQDIIESRNRMMMLAHERFHKKKYSTVGTPDYMSPECLRGLGFRYASDLWSVGVIMFEMLFGFPPFSAETPKQTYNLILNHQKALVIPTYPPISSSALSLLRGLICEEDKRLNLTGIQQHPFFHGLDWASLRSSTPPIIPPLSGPTDCSHFDFEMDDFECNQSVSPPPPPPPLVDHHHRHHHHHNNDRREQRYSVDMMSFSGLEYCKYGEASARIRASTF
eukprot:TRINITY_DN983_c2_g1_i1.p1 TRINITY_DN983_c2_g1~~TRINITY_DN983_c2_g1_i1.p1  ORF type:complete len:583 (+),score=139.63 TRINITY_DN983_c2_g1_i1:74-1822(+)